MKAADAIKIILADDHEIFRDGFKSMLRKQPSISLIGEACNGQELIELCDQLIPDVVVTDIKMPVLDGLAAVRILSSRYPRMGIIALSMIDEESLILEMLEAGARGYLLKNAHKEEILSAIRTVSNGESYYCDETTTRLARMIGKSQKIREEKVGVEFTDRELEVIQLICREATNKEMAAELSLSIRTIEGYREKVQEKIKARNAAGVVIYAIRHGLFLVEE